MPPELTVDPDAAAMMRRRYGPVQPRLEAGMAAIITAAAYPPLAWALRAEGQAAGEAVTPDQRMIPMWTTAVCGNKDLRAMLRRKGTALIKPDTRPPREAPRPGPADLARMTHILMTALMMDSHECYMGLLSETGRDAYTRHCAATAGHAFAAADPPVTALELRHAFTDLICGELAGTSYGLDVLRGVLAAESIGGWPGELLAARSRHLIPGAVTDALGVPLPVLPGPGEYAAGCPQC